MDGMQKALSLLPQNLKSAVESWGRKDDLWEIRLRENFPLSLTVGGENVFIDEKGRPSYPTRAIRCCKQDLDTVLERATDASLYKYMPSLRRGFVTTPQGVRVGICGRGLYEPGQEQLQKVLQISSVNIRIPRFFTGAAEEGIRFFTKNPPASTLFYSPPGGGKTTFIRDLALRCSLGETGKAYRVAVVDERDELFPPELSERGGALDVLRGYSKEDAMDCALRVLNPQFLVCDEIGTSSDCRVIARLGGSGVCFFATAHAARREDLKRKSDLWELIDRGIFTYLARLELIGGRMRVYFSDAREEMEK